MAEHDPSDDDDLELEPIDPEILAHERQRAEDKTRQAEATVDINEIYREAEPIDPITWDDLRGFRFTTRHLLIVTALLAVVLTMIQELKGLGLFLVGVIALGAGWYFVLRKERRERLERQQRREEVERRIAAERGEESADLAAPDVAEAEETLVPSLSFSFSMKEMFGALTVAAVLFALVRGLGGADNAALLLGLIALVGLVVHVVGFEPPGVIVLGWWLLLVLYIVVSIWAALSPDPVASINRSSSPTVLADVGMSGKIYCSNDGFETLAFRRNL